MLRWWIVALFALLAATSIWLTTMWLLHEAQAAPENQRAQVRIDAIRTGLTVGIGAGGAFALLLGARRQWLNERSQAHTEGVALINEADATERRITELYSRAVDQLGNDQPAVRLGALYSLEQLAQNYNNHRQMIVDVICGYLRMPSGLAPYTDEREESGEVPSRREGDEKESQVRLTAQRILTGHMRGGRISTEREEAGTSPVEESFWPDITVDLRGAVLNWWDWTGFTPAIAMFDNAKFVNGANFAHANFTSDVWFTGTEFGQYGNFYNSDFHRRAIFNDVRSESGINLKSCRFHGMTWFERLTHTDSIKLDEALAKVEFDGSWGTERGWPQNWRTSSNEQTRPDGKWVELVQVVPTSDHPGT